MNRTRPIPAVVFLTSVICLLTSAACVHAPGVPLVGGDQQEVSDWNGVDEMDADGWYYRSLEGTRCANGSEAGFGVSRGDDEDLVIYLSGGGACWDDASCRYFQTAANLDVTYDASKLGEELNPLVESGLFDRSAQVNPFRNAGYVYIPYCTADLHTGRSMTAYDGFGGGEMVRHEGARNIERILEVIPEMFPDVRRVWVVGISAGGYGATWNFHRFAEAFGGAELHVFSDASPWLTVDEEQWEQWKTRWNPQIPPDCERCEETPDLLPQSLAKAYPESRFAMSVFARDSVLAAYTRTFPGRLEGEIDEFVEQQITEPNMRVFVADGASHEALLQLGDEVESRDGDKFVDFVREWIEGWE